MTQYDGEKEDNSSNKSENDSRPESTPDDSVEAPQSEWIREGFENNKEKENLND